jgi:dihydrolipoamide dehydrogenase
MTNFDLVVIGAGPGGYVAAIRAAQLNLKVAIVEKEHLGGVCLNWGCIPTKALLRSAEIYRLMHHLDDFGLSAKELKFDLKKVVARSRSIAEQLAKGVKGLLKKHKVEVFDGVASLLPEKNLVQIVTQSGKTAIKANNIIIASGTKARSLPNIESDKNFIWGPREAMTPEVLPKSLLIIGSGAIGIEFASFYNTMGTKVTVVEVNNRILMAEDEEISEFAAKSFTKQGINILTNAKIISVQKNKTQVEAVILHQQKNQHMTFDKVIVAIGVQAHTQDLGLEHSAITFNNGFIVTDAHYQTAEKNVYAIGDVIGAPCLAHKASHEAIIAVEHIAGLKTHPINSANIPGCTYCHPQIASVGLSEYKAKALGYKIKVGKFPFIANGKAIAMGETEGFIKTIFDEETGEFLGAHMIGSEVTELIQGFVMLKTFEGTELDIMHSVFPHPTLSEMMLESTLDAYKKVLHI